MTLLILLALWAPPEVRCEPTPGFVVIYDVAYEKAFA